MTHYKASPEFVRHSETGSLSSASLPGKIKATNKAFKDEWVFDITVRDGKLTRIQEYIDTPSTWRGPPRWTRAPGGGPDPVDTDTTSSLLPATIYGRDL